MRTKTLLLLFLLTCGILNAQDTIRTLVITEARLDDTREDYVEITNVGTTPINLAEFELGVIGAWTVPWNPGANFYFMLPDRILDPGASFVVAPVYDWNPEMWVKAPLDYFRILNKKEMWSLADVKLHFPESPTGAATDSVTPYYHVLELWNGRDCLYLRHHVAPGDSVVVDQVNGVFANADGTRAEPKLAMDVAGMTNATNEATLVRKFSVKQGNIDFEAARGQDLAESEWMPIPHQLGHWEMFRKLFWTAGN
ncbi:MAG: lamin tail domain-containing protein, partial [Methanothrix sp.]|nr:lamin tail domain-containing protein [Methanothrix sp.]